MKIHLSFDYELFFGSSSGSIEKCMLEPTDRLLDMASKHQVPMIFFIDAGYLHALKRHSNNPSCDTDYENVKSQILKLHQAGHEIALHVHPHWEDCVYKNGQWHINTSRYKLADFSTEEAREIIVNYHEELKSIIGEPCHSYRAGGWCIQPFEQIREVLLSEGICVDSSVYPGGYHDSSAHSYDFRKAPNKQQWNFNTDCCMEESNGQFKEIPMTTDTIPPYFYWNLYFKMKSQPAYYKPVGDGSWLKDKKKIYHQFYNSTKHFTCADGFFASRLLKRLKQLEKNKASRMMVLSHPKSLAPCSFDLLEEFIQYGKSQNHEFVTLKSE